MKFIAVWFVVSVILITVITASSHRPRWWPIAPAGEPVSMTPAPAPATLVCVEVACNWERDPTVNGVTSKVACLKDWEPVRFNNEIGGRVLVSCACCPSSTPAPVPAAPAPVPTTSVPTQK